MGKTEHHVVVQLGDITRDWDDYNEIINPAISRAWKDMPQRLNEVSYATEIGEIQITSDWREASEYIFLFLNTDWNDERQTKTFFNQRKPVLHCDVYLPEQTGKKIHRESFAQELVVNFIYDVFVALNLAVPSSANFYRVHIESDPSKVPDIFNLSAYLVDGAWVYSLKHGYPSITELEFSAVWSWFKSIRQGVEQFANSSVERAIFAILHQAHGDFNSPHDFIWTTQALESLYKLPTAMIGKYLQERAYKLLDIPERKKKSFEKSLRELYDKRNSFVHGGFSVTHPLLNDLLDSKVDDYIGDVIQPLEFGHSMIIATLQTMIKNGWKELNFSEDISGISI